ncbi:MAG: hypothetical protein SFU25_07710 [Candidatus Caenarcaniphilales bacterium]|nr:hypothetical protein [Candidatus Caenarcaniphilales bacterium]
MIEKLNKMAKRKKKGSLVFWFLIIAVVGLTLVAGLVFLELLIRWVSLSRVQNAANEAALVYARDMVRLRDEALSKMNLETADFASANLPQACPSEGCTPVAGKMVGVQGATDLEYTNASQTFLYNIWGARISDPSLVDDVRQNQCYKPHNESRFSKIPNSPPNNCQVNNKVSSPIMSLEWALLASPYGTGVCCSNGSNDGNKDFCVNFRATGRMDPVIAGGLPFLTGSGAFSADATGANNRRQLNPVQFITIGDFEINARAVVMRMGSKEGTGDDEGLAQNLSGETIGLETIPRGVTCAAPALTTNPGNPLKPPTSPYTSPPAPPNLPPDEEVTQAAPPNIPPSPLDPGCPPNYSHCATLNQTDMAIAYQCCPPTPPGPPPTCAQNFATMYGTGMDIGATTNKEVFDKFEAAFPSCKVTAHGEYGNNRGSCFNDGTQYGGEYDGACYCPIILSIDSSSPSIDIDKAVKFSFDGKSNKETYWLNSHNGQVGFLVYDLNKNGRVDSGQELLSEFTAGKQFKNGYEALARLFDRNRDLKITAKELEGLLLWIDSNHDGKSVKSELKTMKELNIVELKLKNLDYTKRNILGGGIYPSSEKSVVIKTKDKVIYGSSYDIWFAPYKEVAQSMVF